jgi:hypothetical protein
VFEFHPPGGLPPYRGGGGRFARPNDPESYAGRSVSSCHCHPCQRGQKIGARRSVVPLRPGRRLGMDYDPTLGNNHSYETMEELRPTQGCRTSKEDFNSITSDASRKHKRQTHRTVTPICLY